MKSTSPPKHQQNPNPPNKKYCPEIWHSLVATININLSFILWDHNFHFSFLLSSEGTYSLSPHKDTTLTTSFS